MANPVEISPPGEENPTLDNPPGSISMDPPKTASGVDESQLIGQVLTGDMTAARRLYDAHLGAVHRLAMRMTRDPALAQEATQDTFVRAFRGLRDFRHDASLKVWIHRIAVSSILNALRARNRWNARRAEIEEADLVPLPHEARRTEPDLRDKLYAAIDALPEIYRSVFVLHELEGHDHEEIGTLLGIPSGTSKARLSSARSKLRAALREFEGEWANA
jgi:RNA polymerase sigma-70 factor (ECF subfamily)